MSSLGLHFTRRISTSSFVMEVDEVAFSGDHLSYKDIEEHRVADKVGS